MVEKDITPEYELTAACLNTDWVRGSPSKSKHPGRTEDMFDTPLLSSVRNV